MVLGTVNHADGGQHVPVKLVLERFFKQAQGVAGLVLGKEEPRVGGSRNRRINGSTELSARLSDLVGQFDRFYSEPRLGELHGEDAYDSSTDHCKA